MSARLARIFESNPLAAPVASDIHAFVALAVKVTAQPGQVNAHDVRSAFNAAQSPREYYDAVGVMVAFNFITRIANALGVEPEIPGWMRRIEPLRRLGLRSMALFFRMFVDLDRKEVPGPAPAEHLAAMRTMFAELGLGELPDWVERLTFAPPLLAALHEFFEALVRTNKATGTAEFNVNRFMTIGRTVLQSFPNAETLMSLAENSQPGPGDRDGSHTTALIYRFAKDITVRSYTITRERIDELRAAGLDDAEVLDVAVTAALWGAAARLEVLTGALPTHELQVQENLRAGEQVVTEASHLLHSAQSSS